MGRYLRLFLIATIILTTFHLAQGKDEKYFTLSPDSLVTRGEIYTGKNWKYHPGDKLEWAYPSFNDSAWEISATSLNGIEHPEQEFPGKGWFRLHLVVDSLLINEPISFDLWLAGAAEVYVNGEKILTYGNINDDGSIKHYNPSLPKIISFAQRENLIAIRYYNPDYDQMHRRNFTPGFFLELGYPSEILPGRHEYLSETFLVRNVFMSISLVLAILHLFLFFFDRSQKQNLFYVLFLLFFTLFIYINLSPFYSNDIQALFFLYRIAPGVLVFTILFGSTTINSIYREHGKYLKYFIFVGVILGLLGYLLSTILIWYIIYAFIILVSIWGSHVLYNPKHSRNSKSDWYLRIGFGVMGIMGVYQMLLSFGLLANWGIGMPFIYGVIIFILSMSIALARDYVTTSKKLKLKLEEIQELSEKTLQQELAAKELDIQKRILQADNKRKTDELEAARSVQLAMLPQCLNDIEGLDICFDMKTATEVGGDYYDYKIGEDGTLNIVLGDATGHGMKAGIMVASIKSLFSALGLKMMIPDFFKKCTEIIKSMALGNLFMSMVFIRIKGNTVIGSLAGMPPILVYRKKQNIIEEILQKSMPLGAYLNFPYESFQTEFNSGDVILIQSDGYIELFNAQKEMLGDEKLKEYFLDVADSSSDKIVTTLFEKGDQWRKDHPQEDDITFVAIKKK
ncbi:MAG: SpoIIE family protein phosphatase [Melioribacteraceae bacterium]|nr:MAG: SpoIIE family protein phosphatase [Melioribacteraceae bacterium]